MSHRTFGAVKRAATREPITFDFGVYGEERFTITPEPSLGDCFQLYDAPEKTPTNLLEVARACARFIRSMIDPKDRRRFDEALTRIPASEAGIIFEAAEWITEQVTGFPTPPPEDSSSGRQTSGPISSPSSDGEHLSER